LPPISSNFANFAKQKQNKTKQNKTKQQKQKQKQNYFFI